jgi:hypothetical protein
VKQEGLDNDLLERLKGDKHFWSAARGGPLRDELDWEGLLDPMKYIGRSVEQTERFIAEVSSRCASSTATRSRSWRTAGRGCENNWDCLLGV